MLLDAYLGVAQPVVKEQLVVAVQFQRRDHSPRVHAVEEHAKSSEDAALIHVRANKSYRSLYGCPF